MSCKQMTMQGDNLFLAFDITINDEPLDIETIDTIEFVVGELTKYYRTDGEVIYDEDSGVFLFPLSQEETFNFHGKQKVQVRIKNTDGYVIGKVVGNIDVMYSLSKEVL